MRSPCFELRPNVVLFGNKKYPCQRIIIFSASFNYSCVSLVLCACNTMCLNFFQKVFACQFSWTCLLLDILLHIWPVSGLHYVDKHSKFSMPSFDKLGFQCPKLTWKVRLACKSTPSLPVKKLGCYIGFLPNFELFKLEFSGCVFQAYSFLLENLGQNWLAISKPPGNKHSSLILKTDSFFFFPILEVLGATWNLARK